MTSEDYVPVPCSKQGTVCVKFDLKHFPKYSLLFLCASYEQNTTHAILITRNWFSSHFMGQRCRENFDWFD